MKSRLLRFADGFGSSGNRNLDLQGLGLRLGGCSHQAERNKCTALKIAYDDADTISYNDLRGCTSVNVIPNLATLHLEIATKRGVALLHEISDNGYLVRILKSLSVISIKLNAKDWQRILRDSTKWVSLESLKVVAPFSSDANIGNVVLNAIQSSANLRRLELTGVSFHLGRNNFSFLEWQSLDNVLPPGPPAPVAPSAPAVPGHQITALSVRENPFTCPGCYASDGVVLATGSVLPQDAFNELHLPLTQHEIYENLLRIVDGNADMLVGMELWKFLHLLRNLQGNANAIQWERR